MTMHVPLGVVIGGAWLGLGLLLAVLWTLIRHEYRRTMDAWDDSLDLARDTFGAKVREMSGLGPTITAVPYDWSTERDPAA